MAAAKVAGNHSPELYISRATIQLRLPQTVAPARVYEWCTQVTAMPKQQQQQQQQQEVKETDVECIKQNGSSTTAPTTSAAVTPMYTPPRIKGDEAKRKNLPQTLGNFFEAERFNSAWNRVTK